MVIGKLVRGRRGVLGVSVIASTGDRMRDRERRTVQVPPPQRAQLPAPGAGHCGESKVGGQFGIVLTREDQQPLDLFRGRRIDPGRLACWAGLTDSYPQRTPWLRILRSKAWTCWTLVALSGRPLLSAASSDLAVEGIDLGLARRTQLRRAQAVAG